MLTDRRAAGRLSRGLAGAAVLIGVITIFARIAGFSRTLVFSHAVGNNCLGTTYFTANQVTNIVFEIVAGGALSSMVVPVLSKPAADGAPETRRIASALLTWTVVILVPVSALAVLLARPVMTLLVPSVHGCDRAQVIDLGTRMLVVFAPQIVFYGLAVVSYGVLQAHRRFLGPALAPLVSSLVVVGAYLTFVVTGSAYRHTADQADLGHVTRAAELTLSLGTTLGVVAMVLTVVGPTVRLRLRLRPSLRFPPGVATTIRRLAVAGIATLLAQQAAWTIVVWLANGRGGEGALPVYNYAWALYQLPYAVLAVPLATSAFQILSVHGAAGDREAFSRTAASTTRVVVLLSLAGATVLAATAMPVARIFLLGTGRAVTPPDLAHAIVAFAPGLLGYGLLAHVGRTLFAAGHGRLSAACQVAGWLTVIGAEVAMTAVVSRSQVVAALGLGNAIGMTLAGVLLVGALVVVRGWPSVAGLPRALAAGVAGAAAGYAAGAGVASAFGPTGLAASIPVALASAVAALAAFLAATLLIDGRDMRAALARLRGRGRRGAG